MVNDIQNHGFLNHKVTNVLKEKYNIGVAKPKPNKTRRRKKRVKKKNKYPPKKFTTSKREHQNYQKWYKDHFY